MEYGYSKIIKDNNLSVSDLPEEVQVAIDSIVDIEKGLAIVESKCKKNGKEFIISEKTKKKIKTLDGWAIRGVQEHLDGKEIKGAAPVTSVEIINEVKNDNAPPASAPPIVATVIDEKQKSNDMGTKIESELSELDKEGISEITLDDLKSKAPSSYKVIFDNYNESEENGIETTNFKLIENDKKNYILTKK